VKVQLYTFIFLNGNVITNVAFLIIPEKNNPRSPSLGLPSAHMAKFFKGALCAVILVWSATNSVGQSTVSEKGIRSTNAVYTLYKGGTIHHPDGNVEEADILEYKGKITAYGKSESFSLEKNTRTVSLEGLHVYPSFIEMKGSYGLHVAEEKSNSGGPQYKRSKDRPVYPYESIHPEYNAVDQFEPDEKEAEKLRALGIGAVLTIAPDGIARGTSALVLTGDEDANKQTLKERAASHFSFEKGSSGQAYPNSLMGAVALFRQAFYDAHWYASAEQPETDRSLEALAGQTDGVMIFEGRDKYDLHRLGRVAEELELDFIAYEPGHAYESVTSLSPRIRGLIIPLKTPTPFDTDDPDLLRFVDQSDMLHWERAPYNAIALQNAEIPFAFTTEGLEKPEELLKALRKLRSLGTPENVILEALTLRPAELLGVGDRIGKIAPGYGAHFFTVSGDIFNDKKAEIQTHYIRGKSHTVNPSPEADLTGVYDLNVNNLYLELRVKGKHPKYEGNIRLTDGSDTTKIKAAISLLGREVGLSFAAPDSSGRYRLSASARSRNRIWDGTGTGPQGENIKWSAIHKNDKTPEAKKDSAKISAPEIPPMRYPLAAYGYDSLPQAETLWITHATVWTNNEKGVIRNGEIIIHGGKIMAVGSGLIPAEHLPADANESLIEYNAKGMHITPGIIDEHSHIAISRGVNEGTEASTAEVRISDALNPSDINIYRQLAGGVTTSQLLHGSANPIGGQSAIVKMRRGQPYAKMVFAEAPGSIKFALGENVKQTNWGERYTSRYPQTRMGVEQFFYEYFYRAKAYDDKKRLHESSIAGRRKLFFRKQEPAPVFRKDLELEALVEILNGERHITCHSYVQSEINMLMHVADSMGFKVNTFTHILEGYKIAERMERHGAAGSTFSDWWAYKYEVLDAIPYNAALMNRAGVLTGINSDDAEMGRRLNQEAAKAVKYGGMSEEDALKTVTLNPAKMLHIDHLTGSLEKGKHADLVVWNDHPLSVYSRAEITFVDGCRYFDRGQNDALAERDRRDRARIADAMRTEKENGSETRKPERKMERYYHCDDIEEQ